jgi:hypothetical protein
MIFSAQDFFRNFTASTTLFWIKSKSLSPYGRYKKS